ncbi:MAG TPA: glutaredoxin family protein [Casimicrobiaceae bacterium]
MRAALLPIAERAGATIVEIDVDAEPALEAAFGERVPVLLHGGVADGRELCHFRLDAARVRRALGVAP